MKVLVTGGAGFIGSHIVDGLINDLNASVIVIDNLSTGHEENIHPMALFKNLDIKNSRKLAGFMRGCHVVINCTGTDESSLRSDSIDLMKSLYDAISKTENTMSTFINISDYSVYGPGNFGMAPVNEDEVNEETLTRYGLTSLYCEKIASQCHYHFGKRVINVRPSIVCGPRQRYGNSLSRCLESVFSEGKTKGVFLHDSLKAELDLIHVHDVRDMIVELLVNLSNLKSSNDVFNIGTGSSIKLQSLVSIIESKYNVKFSYGIVPDMLYSEINSVRLSVKKCSNEIGYVPNRRLKSIIEDTCAWYVNNMERWRDG